MDEQNIQSMPLVEFLNEFKQSLIQQVQEQITPVYNGNCDNYPDYDRLLQGLKRKPFAAQANAVQALMKLLVEKNQRMGILNGEMGVGKTAMGIFMAYLMHLKGFKRTLILCPPHLVYKWKREIENTLEHVDVIIINGSGSIRSLNNIRQNLKRYGRHRPAFFIVGRVRLRMGGNWQHAFSKRKLAIVEQSTDEINLDVLACNDCGQPIKNNEAYHHAVNKLPQRQHSCFYCGSKLWQYGLEKKEVTSSYDKLFKALCQLPTVGKIKAAKLLEDFGENLLLNSLEDNLYQLVNLIDEQGNFVFTDKEARRIEKAIMKSEFALSAANFQVSEFIKRYFPHNYFGLLICDEAHEYKNAGSAQGQAMGVVASQCRKVLLLTGTLMGGYASDLFYLLYRSMPGVMKKSGYKYSNNGSLNNSMRSFLIRYGILQYSYNEGEAKNFKTAKGRNKHVTERPAPGFSVKGIARYLLPYTVFLRLQDIDQDALVPYTEHAPIMLPMEEALAQNYEALSSKLNQKMRTALAQGDRTLLGTVLNALMSYSETAFLPMLVKHPKTGEPLASGDQVLDDKPSIKEQALVNLCLQQKSQNRRVLIYTTLTDTRDTRQRIKAFLTDAGLKTDILNSSVSTQKREDWLLNKVDQGIDALITNPKLVETGLDLIEFPSIVFMQVGYNVYTAMQAMRRSWRIGQTVPVEIFFLCYQGTAQQSCLELMAKKIKVTQSTAGEMPNSGLEALNQSADNIEMAIAKKLINKEEIDSSLAQNTSLSTLPEAANIAQVERTSLKTVITSGVYDFAEEFNCFWLIKDISIILSKVYQMKKDSFYGIVFSQENGQSMLTFDDGNKNVLYTHTYDSNIYDNNTQEFVDLEIEKEVKFFLSANDHLQSPSVTFVLMFPSEY